MWISSCLLTLCSVCGAGLPLEEEEKKKMPRFGRRNKLGCRCQERLNLNICNHSMGKWFRQVIPAGSQIDLLRQEIRRYCIRHVNETEHISDWRITLSSTGFHFDPLDSSGNPLENAKEFVKPARLHSATSAQGHSGHFAARCKHRECRWTSCTH